MFVESIRPVQVLLLNCTKINTYRKQRMKNEQRSINSVYLNGFLCPGLGENWGNVYFMPSDINYSVCNAGLNL